MSLRRFLLSLVCLAALPAQAVELVKWERIPLPVSLHVGQERIVFVNRNVRVGFPPELKGKLRVQSTGGAVYLQPGELFARTRLVLQDVENGEMILLDISAEEGKNVLEPVSLVYQGEVSSSTGNGDVAVTDNKTATTGEQQSISKPKDKKSATPLPVAMTRYAAQSLYAPSRTIEPLPGVHTISLALPERLTSLLPSESVEVKPLAAWGLLGYSVVALTLRNQRSEKVVLDPRRLQGNFYSATFQHRWLGASGTPEDTTTVYLVTKGRPDAAFLPEPVKAKTGKGGKVDAD
ncbi:TIGR03749 family integrating conjugative element protein [Escherichia coli]|uniref:TIGR03749 family integrating conjugative element protein n=1 Tax=Escherichia coli TaxID=562 RepID=UPI000BDF92B8|nr:TIGR03749 family integrating conjugative element protein [Escherichia coli]EFK3940061.1 TIGR03749 family integrating conjugative element protein [Escherichia coli]EFK3984357.1 TIGR03749 family integrating conjugative element protein [Escherichia coli]EGF8441113.1 TIGR03749 family integrating conjugative element protein [Escherichia coli]EGM8458329.1 TIGR03749 family integrating conjugative element protein [Escherichia coli]EGO7077738.1 TIGR03749 family integrating conjugative element protei